MIIGIIGGGASGMTAALFAAKNPDVQVFVFERQNRVGRKLQATGNGRCNLSNLYANNGGYHGEEPEFARLVISSFKPEETLEWFRELGLYTVSEESGRVYPYSNQANSVVDVLRIAMKKENVQLITGYDVQKIRIDNGVFSVSDGKSVYNCHKLIVACGGLAGTKLGGTMSGYKLMNKLGHKCTRLRPALVQLKSSWKELISLKGVRTNCEIIILRNGVEFNHSVGELQFTEYGISGPVVFEVSRDVCQEKGIWTARIDFLPDISADKLEKELKRRKQTPITVDDLLTGILHNRLGRVLTKTMGISGNQYVYQLNDYEIQSVVSAVKEFEINLTEPMGMDSAQVTAGGMSTREFDVNTMESKLVPGLYACGELLDVDGDCGGYNLQWAWSSGRLAGLSAGEGIK